jgi:hypothetical protein
MERRVELCAPSTKHIAEVFRRELLLPVARLNALEACILPTAAMVQLKMQCHGYTRLYTATVCPLPPSLFSSSSSRCLSCPNLSLFTDHTRPHHSYFLLLF